MRAEAASAGFYTSRWGSHPRIQLRTVAELLAGKGIDYPRTKVDATFRRTPKAKSRKPEQAVLLEPPEPKKPKKR